MLNNNLNCIQADMQKEVFDNICQSKLNEILQSKFGEYADVICNTKPTVEGGETLLTLGIYDVKENLINFSEELSSMLGMSNSDTKTLIEKYLEIFNLSADIEWDEKKEKAKVSIFLDTPYIDEFTKEEDLNLIKAEEKMLISEKLADCLESFIQTFMHDANVEFGYKWQEWLLSNPEF